jgi:hypothetical protein
MEGDTRIMKFAWFSTSDGHEIVINLEMISRVKVLITNNGVKFQIKMTTGEIIVLPGDAEILQTLKHWQFGTDVESLVDVLPQLSEPE